MLVKTQQEAEREAAQAIKARNLSDCINRLNNEFYKAWEGMQNFKAAWARSRSINFSFRDNLKSIRERYKELIALTTDQKEIQRHIYLSLSQLDEGDRIVDQTIKDLRSGHMDEVLQTHSEKMQRIKQLFRDCMSHELTMFAEHEKAVADSSQARQAELRQQIGTYAVLAVLFSIIFSVCIAVFVVKRITSRIETINDNAFRLASSEKLNPVMEGSDEIARLDQVFHTMAEVIEETARMRQELVNMLTHDLRSPLTTIQGCFDMLGEGMLGELNDRGERMIKVADRNGARMMGLINDLLDVEKMKSGMMTIDQTEVELKEVFNEVSQNVSDWANEHDLKLDISKTDLVVRADQEKLIRVLFNLIGNAIKFSPKGGTISVKAEQNEDYARITVSDEGRGIPKEAIGSIFERFQQVKDEHAGKGGSGLGLAICQSIVQLHGGRIWVESEVGRGSNFVFLIPLVNKCSDT